MARVIDQEQQERIYRLFPLDELDDDDLAVFIKMLGAFEIYLARNGKYKGLWKTMGWKDSVHHILSKAARIKRMMWEGDDVDDVDSIVDLINYCCFALINIEDGNKTGAP